MEKKIRILHVLNYLGFAGMETGVIKLANRLPKENFETIICVLGDSAPGIRGVIDPSVRVVELNKSEGFDPKVAWRLARLTRSADVDIVHSHNWGTYVYAALAKMLGAQGQFVHGEHGRDAADLHISIRQRVFLRATRFLVKRYTSVARHLSDELSSAWRVPTRQFAVLPNGVDLERFALPESPEEIRCSLAIPVGATVIGAVGNIRPIKGFPTIFEAAAQLATRYPNLVVVMCGGSAAGRTVPDSEQSACAAQCAPAKIVFLHSRLDVERVLRTFDIFVNSSYLEGMSNSILEAMASDCPVVASDIPGNREILQDGGMGNLFPPGDARALADRIAELLDDPQRRMALIRRQREWVTQVFSAKASVDRYVQFYREIACVPGRETIDGSS